MSFTLSGFASHLRNMALQLPVVRRYAMERACVIVETEAKRVIGTYDYGWRPLAESTVARKGADTPLLETGSLRESITHEVRGDLGRVFSNDPKAAWHELGTRTIPPRPFLSEAARRKAPEVAHAIGRDIAGYIATGSSVSITRGAVTSPGTAAPAPGSLRPART